MHPALWVSKTGLDAQQMDVSVISNNLANVNTVGYKRSRAAFEDLLYQTVRQPGGQSSSDTELPSGLMMGTGVKIVATEKIFTQGSSIQTNNPFDLSINGRGFFQITLPDGSIGYTRDGKFQIDKSGQLVTASGNPMQPAVTIPSGAQSVSVGSDGVVNVLVAGTSTPTQAGTIQLADFINPAGLQPQGENIYAETVASGSPQTGNPGQNGLGKVSQGALEASNVNVVEELVGLIESQRAYEMNSKAIQTVDSMLQYISQTL